ncbi:hydrolase [Streptomyces sp. NPDC085460]|uniref:hydrolase n=1 Tax=Streptomyces sp. NPDC085460 TaxID=3365723 RepID=UPI0037D825C3
MESLMSRLPAEFLSVRYDGSRFPGAASVAARPGLGPGANCQLYAYEVLRHFGLNPPDLRSSELWDDTERTVRVPVDGLRPLDLLLFNSVDRAYGAHVGVWAGEGEILHLCAEAGRPVVWRPEDFAARERYGVLLGAKRVLPGLSDPGLGAQAAS